MPTVAALSLHVCPATWRLIRFLDLAGSSIRNDAIHHRLHDRGMRLAAYKVSQHVAGLHVVVEVHIKVAYYKHGPQIADSLLLLEQAMTRAQ
jgi:hypothetical protein